MTRHLPVDPSDLAPLDRLRIEDVMHAKQWHYSIDIDGNLRGFWAGNLFYFLLAGDAGTTLQIRGLWHRRHLPLSTKPRLLELLDDFHREHLWPKAFTTVDDDGEMRVVCEVAVDLAGGVTDDRLELLLAAAITEGCALFALLDVHLPLPRAES
jgi:hypothetical protein